MKTNGQKVKLGDLGVADLIMGVSPSSKFYNNNGDGLPFLQGSAQFGELNPITDIFTSEAIKIADFGDTLISVRAPVGDLNVADKKYCIGRGLAAIRAKEKINSKFLFYYLLINKNKIQSESSGSTFKSINKNVLENFEILLPSKSTQQKIVKVLDGVRAEIGKQKEIIDATKELKRSLMKKLFSDGTRGEKLKETEIGKIPASWEVVKLGDTARINPQNKYNLKDDERVGFVSMADVSNDGYIQNIQERLYKDIKNGFTKFQNGDYLFAKITPCMENGKGGLYKSDKFKYGFGSTEFYVVRVLEKVISEFISYLVNVTKFRKTAAENMSGACGQKRVSKDFLIEYKFGLPSIDEQKEIASILQKVDERIELAKQQKKLYEELFDVLLNRLMSGEIDAENINI